ncbi:WXG100 family type VII secretion target [Amycolatopsis sp. TRM77291]
MSWLSNLADGVGGLFSGLGKAVGDALKGVFKWTRDLFTGDVGTQPVPVPEFVEKVRAGNSSPWHEAARQAGQAAKSQGEHAAVLREIIGGLESSWSGTGADAARERIHKLYTVADSADRSMARNQQSVLTAASGFEHTKATLKPMPPRPDKSFGDVISPWDTDTEKAIADYNEKAKFNLTVYKGYENQIRQTQSGLQGDYGQLGFYDGADIALTPPVKRGPAPAPDHPAPPDDTLDRADLDDGSGFTPSPAPDHTPASFTPGGGPHGGTGMGADHTTTSGYGPSTRDGASTPVVPAPSTGPSAGGRADTGSGFGSGFAPGGPGGRTGGVPTAGRGGGAGVLGGPLAAETGRVNARSTGAGAASGALGGAMAPGARGGKNEDDEHTRKYGPEEHPVEITDIDPETGFTVVPPTIGT